MSIRFDAGRAIVLSDVSRAAYPDRRFQFEFWKPADLVDFELENFTGFVASNKEMTVVSFRGTHMNVDSIDNLRNSIGQWLRNLDYAQVCVDDEYCVHRGYFMEYQSSFGGLRQLIGKQYSKDRPMFLVGHSAGAALATLFGNFLAHDKGANPMVPAGVYAYSSPRVGDKRFSDQYPVPLYRFERGFDLVPHFPLSPLMSAGIQKVGITDLISSLQRIFQFLGADVDPEGILREDLEYVHAGRLFYHENDQDGVLYASQSILEFGIRTLFEWLTSEDGDGKSSEEPEKAEKREKVVALPKQLLDVGRVVSLAARAVEQIEGEADKGSVGFVSDHGIDPTKNFLKSLFLGQGGIRRLSTI